jgi:O-antigen ligase
MRWFQPSISDAERLHWPRLSRTLWIVLAVVQIFMAGGMLTGLILDHWLHYQIPEPTGHIVSHSLLGLLWSLPIFALLCCFVDGRLAWAAFRFFLVIMFFILIVPMGSR